MALHLVSRGAARLRCFLWLYMVFNLLVSSGYVVFSGVTDFGNRHVYPGYAIGRSARKPIPTA